MSTTWQPDTCGCVIVYDYDAGTDTFTVNRVPVKCDKHDTLTDAQLFAAVHSNGATPGENRRLNLAKGRLQATFPALFDSSGTFLGTWSFSGTGSARTLNLTLPGLTTNQKNNVQSWCDTNLGAGRVVVS